MEGNINPSQIVDPSQPIANIDNTNLSKNKEIKCGNCGYIGPGEKNRSLFAVILAWICIIIAPIITLIYFVATHTWKCPKCKSTFVGVKNKKGIYAGQLDGGVRWVLIILFVIIGIAVFGILSSVVLASLNAARTKGQDATIKAGMANLRVQSMLYEDKTGTFKGFCNDSGSIEVLKKISVAGASNEYSYVCNDSEKNWAISNPLRSKGYWCIDSSENEPRIMDLQLINQVLCSTSNSTTTENKNLTAMRDLLKDEFVNGCASGSTPKTYCVCVFDKMEEGLGLDGLLDVFEKYEETKTMDAKTLNLIKPCSN
jgi:type II secretory pathway pseudopilin PulG